MRFPLPYAFARTHQLLLEDDGHAQTLVVHAQASPAALGEVLRKYPSATVVGMDADMLVQRISAAYSQGESSAALVASEVASDVDLQRMMQELPAVEDLLEAADDAPIIRLLNALLTQAAREGAAVFAGNQQVGVLTSGGFSPTLERPIAMAYVAAEHSAPCTALEIEVRGKRLPARVTALPFVPHRYHR